MMRVTLTVAVALMAAIALAQSPIYSNFGGTADPGAIGLSTGPLTYSGVAAPAGTTWSECSHDNPNESNTSAGFAQRRTFPTPTTDFRLADDFTVPAGWEWTIDSVRAWGYRTGHASTPPSPYARAYLQIWNGRPGDAGSTVIWGDLTTNRLVSSTFASMYRIFNTVAPPPGTAPGTTRAIWENVINVGVTLYPGTYWLDWTYEMSDTAWTAFTPTITIPGIRGLPGWNARQWQTTLWADVIDTGNPATAPDYPQDIPFILVGVAIPEPASLLLIGVGLLGVLRRR